MNKQIDDTKSQQMIVVGTEAGQVLFLAPSGNEIRASIQLQSVPVVLICEG